MSSREDLERIFRETVKSFASSNREQLSYREMIALADVFEGWAMDERVSPERSATILGWAEGMRRLAEDAGPDWDPPKPAKPSLLAAMGKWVLDEPTPTDAPARSAKQADEVKPKATVYDVLAKIERNRKGVIRVIGRTTTHPKVREKMQAELKALDELEAGLKKKHGL